MLWQLALGRTLPSAHCRRAAGGRQENGVLTFIIRITLCNPMQSISLPPPTGEPLVDGESGDLIFVVQTQPHPRFVRKGNDLWLPVNITLVDALTGFDLTVRCCCGWLAGSALLVVGLGLIVELPINITLVGALAGFDLAVRCCCG